MNILESLISHFEDPFHRGPCETVTHAAELMDDHSKCQLRVELALDDQLVIQEAWWDGHGCSTCEGMCSQLVEQIQHRDGERAVELASELLWRVETSIKEANIATPASCRHLPSRTLQQALVSPLSELADDLADPSSFGGPSLREEC